MNDIETMCAAFWNHTNIRSGNRIFPCCRFKTPVAKFNGDVGNILFSDEYQSLRNLSIKNEKIAGCEKCYYEESLGKKSLRQEFNKQYSFDKIQLQYLEIGFDNICNLTCDGCWGEFSSAWGARENPSALKKTIILSTEEFVSLPPTINKIVFLGGEPLMTNRHSTFLKSIQNKHKVSVMYYTNATFLIKQHDIILLNQFKHVKFVISVDGVGVINEQVRSGSDWNDVLSFILQIKQTKFESIIHSVIHINNWFNFGELKKFVDSKNFCWTTNVLTYPAHLDIINLSLEDKNKLNMLLIQYDIPNKGYIKRHIDG